MGADLITFIGVGPSKLSRSKALRKKAETKLKSFVEMAVKWSSLVDKIEDPQPDTDIEVLQDQLDKLDTLGDTEVDNVRWAREYQDDPKKLLNELFEVWDSGSSRDVNKRLLPDPSKNDVWRKPSKKKSIVVAGDMSWGDPPDGFGFQTLMRSEQVGLCTLYGIE